MLNIRSAVICISMSLVLCGCSSETSPSNANKVVNDVNKAGNAINQSSSPKIAAPTSSESDLGRRVEQQAIEIPTRSELRVLSEQAKMNENEIQNVIEQFDANLDNPEVRKDVQAKFRQILPEYKEQMLQIGKAKLKEIK